MADAVRAECRLEWDDHEAVVMVECDRGVDPDRALRVAHDALQAVISVPSESIADLIAPPPRQR